jgi:hypothetical protein
MNNHVRVARFAEYQVRIAEEGDWSSRELDDLFSYVALLAGIMNGPQHFMHHIGEVAIERADTGSNLGLAYHDHIQLSKKHPFSAWSVVHELAHVWDAKNKWGLSLALQRYTRGFTSAFLSRSKRFFMPYQWDAGIRSSENTPGSYGRKPGCNAYGYFYGGRPSGSNWRFNRKEDFAESVVMYCGWERGNDLSRAAHGRIERYRLPNGSKDPVYGIIDNWSDYARYFYPQDGDYTKTKRWRFIDGLMQNRMDESHGGPGK